MPQRTPLYAAHLAAGGSIVDFAGWELPIHYGSQLKEHEVVRSDAGMFDVSHMTAVDISGADATAYLQRLLANDVARLGFIGKALYSAMLNEQGGVIDDLIAYRTTQGYRLVINAATTSKDLAWMTQHAQGMAVVVQSRRDLAMLAIQGPQARAKVASAYPALAQLIADLPIFAGQAVGDWFVARTGYTGEDGLEIALPADEAETLWNNLLAVDIAPTGLGARDTLRLEAGMNLYGNEMDETISPLAAGMGWTIAWQPERDFIGRTALLQEQAARAAGNVGLLKQVGLLFQGRGVLRAHMSVQCASGAGEISSGTFSPTLKCSVAMARVPLSVQVGDSVQVLLRGELASAQVVRMPFVRQGKPVFSTEPA